jgi:hypothetical protein
VCLACAAATLAAIGHQPALREALRDVAG